MTAAKRQRVYERDGHMCVHCRRTDDLTIDHIWPRALGGSNHIDNLQTLCGNCNRQKADRAPDDTPRPHLLTRKKIARITALSKGDWILHSRDCHPVWGCVNTCPVQQHGMLTGWKTAL